MATADATTSSVGVSASTPLPRRVASSSLSCSYTGNWITTCDIPANEGARPLYKPLTPSSAATLRSAENAPLYGTRLGIDARNASECCTCSRVLTTHSGLVTNTVAIPAPAADTMCLRCGDDDGAAPVASEPPPPPCAGSMNSLSPSYTVKYTAQLGKSATIVGVRPR